VERHLRRCGGSGPPAGMTYTYFLGFSALLAFIVWRSIKEL